MTVEANLTRELGIRFIDARKLATEARIAEGIDGYPTKEENVRVVRRALEIFDAKPEEEKAMLVRMNDDLESIKSSHHSRANKGDMDDSSNHSASTIGSNASETSLIQKVVSLSSLRRKKKDALAASGIGAKNATFNLLGGSSSNSSSSGNIRKATSMGGLRSAANGKQRNMLMSPQKNVVFEGMPPRTGRNTSAGSRVNHLGSILDIKVPTN